ncbi:hypothetical protein [Stakelama tenebrarum]|uniref:Uncharacterized protein n=1 Tax=Stakelama tenebrarum TaxID=2711215 RepID=A0A6G6Y274_9SPHN|nr:hypothetical protein [Sphingosinithalassobacter tenebrarum]QIG78999.1 hypothetical protein G5C33_03840 [Sphingosinithalassobacter tenebrarum]
MRKLLLLLAALAATPVAMPPASAQQTVSVDEQAAIADAERRGHLIYAYDQAAWHGTDDMVEKVPDYGSRIGGYVVEGPVAAPRLFFYDRDTETPRAVYSARFEGARLVSSHVYSDNEDRSLSPRLLGMIAARDLALEAAIAERVSMCSRDNPNFVVLPPDTPDAPVSVYLLTPQPSARSYAAGGHYRFDIAPDGTLAEYRRFANSCLTLEAPQSEVQRASGMMGVTHLLDPTPTEIHVFTALASGMPLVVATTENSRTWLIRDGHITPFALSDGEE